MARSDLVFRAMDQVSDRYQLCQLVTKATRRLHKPNTRVQETISNVLTFIHATNPEAKAASAASVTILAGKTRDLSGVRQAA